MSTPPPPCTSLLSVYLYGQPCLTLQNPVAAPVTETMDLAAIQTTLQQMSDLVSCAGTAGLAGPQINQPFRYFVSGLGAFINPAVTQTEGTFTILDGCMSIPGVYEQVTRPNSIWLQYDEIMPDTRPGAAPGALCLHTVPASNVAHGSALQGEIAFIIQHEIDHLNGVLFIDHLAKPLPENDQLTLNNLAAGIYVLSPASPAYPVTPAGH